MLVDAKANQWLRMRPRFSQESSERAHFVVLGKSAKLVKLNLLKLTVLTARLSEF